MTVNYFAGCHPHDLNLSYDVYREQSIIRDSWHCDIDNPDWINRIYAYERMILSTEMMYDPAFVTVEPAYLVKPCPFCGLQMEDSDLDDALHPVCRVAGKRELGVMWSINCLECAGGCGVQMLGDTEQEVIEKWNRRAR